MTFCIAVEAKLNTDICPLSKGRCYWQHTVTKTCAYTEKELSVPEFCATIGVDEPVGMSLEEFKLKLRSTL